jgi:hypothetical protein
VFGAEIPQKWAASGKVSMQSSTISEQVISCWVPPKKHIVQFYADRVASNTQAENEVDFDSDQADSEASDTEEDDINAGIEPRPHDNPNSYAWQLIRLASVLQIQSRLRQFIALMGFESAEMASLSPRLDNLLKLLNNWSSQLEVQIEAHPDGCPIAFLPTTYVEADSATQTTPLLRKYRSLVERGNTPFEYDARGVLPVKRLWSFLVRQENLSTKFIKYIFGAKGNVDTKERFDTVASTITSQSGSTVSDSIKIVQREHEAITAFACNSVGFPPFIRN